MTSSRYSAPGALAAVASLLLAFAMILASGQSHAQERLKVASAETAAPARAGQEPATTGAVSQPAGDDATCERSRRRLWVEGEGWIVRRVTVCR